MGQATKKGKRKQKNMMQISCQNIDYTTIKLLHMFFFRSVSESGGPGPAEYHPKVRKTAQGYSMSSRPKPLKIGKMLSTFHAFGNGERLLLGSMRDDPYWTSKKFRTDRVI